MEMHAPQVEVARRHPTQAVTGEGRGARRTSVRRSTVSPQHVPGEPAELRWNHDVPEPDDVLCSREISPDPHFELKSFAGEGTRLPSGENGVSTS